MSTNSFIGTSDHTQRYVEMIEAAFQTRNNTLLWGNPGVGKTALINALAAHKGRHIRTVLGSTMEPGDVAGFPFLNTMPDGTKVADFSQPEWFRQVCVAAEQNPEGAVLYLDEVNLANEYVEAALLTFIQDRFIGKYKLPDNVYIIASGNPPAVSTNGRTLSPAMSNRFLHIDYEPSIPDWFEGMLSAWEKPVSLKEAKMRNLIVAYLVENQTLVNVLPEDLENAGGAWPSMRSWDNAARMLGQSMREEQIAMFLHAAVGAEATNKFERWRSRFQEPDYSTVIANPASMPWGDMRADQLTFTLSSITDQLKHSTEVDSVIRVFETVAAAVNKPDVILTLVGKLRRKAQPLSNDFTWVGYSERLLDLTTSNYGSII